MRLGVKATEALGVTLLTFCVVAAAALVHLFQITTVVLRESIEQASLIEKQIFDQSRQTLLESRAPSAPEALAADEGLQRFLEASVGYSPHLLYAMIADLDGKAILHTAPQKIGQDVPVRPKFEELLELGPLERLLRLYKGGEIYESTLPMSLNGMPFGTVKLGIHTSLLRGQLSASLTKSLTFAAIALPIAWVLTWVLATLTLRPLHTLARQMERLREGDFDATTGLQRTDEFQDLVAQLQLLGQQLKSHRLRSVNEQVQLQNVVDHLADGMVLINHEHRILFCNKAAEAVMGSTAEHVAGKLLVDVCDPAHPLRRLFEEVLATKASVCNSVLVLPAADTRKDFLVSVFCMMEGPLVAGAVALLRDVESTKTLQSLITYSAKLTALGRLTSGVAHEVKNPLNSMAIHVELLKDHVGISSGDARRSLEVIEGEIRRLDRVVQGFLKFMRPQELRLSIIDITTLLKKETALLETDWGRKGIAFILKMDSVPLYLAADEELLGQVFLNLLLNACQAMPQGGTVTIEAGSESNGSIAVRIADTGHGIPASNLDRIFQLYYTTKADGSGLGLPLAYRIIQMHDGTIDVTSEEGRGTIVTVHLPTQS